MAYVVRTDSDANTDWHSTYERLSSAGRDDLSSADLELLAQAAFWVGRPRDSIPPRRELYARQLAAGDDAGAAVTAWRLFCDHFDLDLTAAANGWLRRARRHAAVLPDSIEQGYVSLGCAEWSRFTGEPQTAVGHARQAVRAGESADDADLTAMAQASEARALVMLGDVAGGVAMIDEAMLTAVDGRLSPFATGWVYCVLLTVCHELGDVRRATEWTDLALRWCQHLQDGGYFPGVCRLHQCEVRSLLGQWSDAEMEALRAAEELTAFGDYLVAEGHYIAGDIRRLKGDVEGARRAFRRAHELGRDPQPALALLQAAEGDVGGAQAALRVAAARATAPTMHRARLLAASAHVELRAGDIPAALTAIDALDEIASTTPSRMLRATALLARGEALLAAGDAHRALAVIHDASEIWHELSCPYEVAQARSLIGLAARLSGDDDTAERELDAARRGFEKLGAAPDAARCAALIAGRGNRPRGLTEREIEVLRLVAHGRSNRDIAEALFISEHTVARHLSNAFRKLDVTSRAAATAFVFEHDLV